MTSALDTMAISQLTDQLAAHKTLGAAPREELEWLARHGERRHYGPGDVATMRDQPVTEMFITLSGRIVQYLARGGQAERRPFMEWRTGEITGTLPYSRMHVPPGDSVCEEPTEVLVLSREHFPALIRECPNVTTILVHVMLDRGRLFTSTHFEDEKMMSLGRLAAGLAHELNNPASAAARSSALLTAALGEMKAASGAIADAHLTSGQRRAVDEFGARLHVESPAVSLSPLERADHEDDISQWIESHGADPVVAATLADVGVTTAALDALASDLSAQAIGAALRWIAAESAARALAADLERTSSRIHELVSAVKRFTYMDRARVAAPASLAQGIHDTVAMFAARAREKSVTLQVQVPADLPEVLAFGGELNQVWTNLIDNALDAVPASGQVMITAERDGERVIVRVIDDGPGIPADVRARMFEPFFTTKPVGEGTGLGLDIAWRIVRRHGGSIDVDSQPGRTEMRVTLPIERDRLTP